MNTKKPDVQTTDPLQEEVIQLKQQNAELTAKVQWYEEQFRINQHRLYGRSSEITPPDQISLFNEAEADTKPDVPEPTFEEITYKRHKQPGQREEMLKELPVETIEYRLPENDQKCPECGGPLHEMSTEVRQEIKIIPAQVSVVKHVRYVYSCRHCEQHEIVTPVQTASMPKPVIPGSLASPSAIAYIMSQKFVEGLPLYRQEEQWKRLGLDIPRQTMANWMIKGANWLAPLFERMREHLLQKDILHADETTLQVLHEPERSASSTSYIWLYRTGREGPPIILYEYQTTRASKHPVKFLKGFKGYLHADGYAGYESIPDITLVGCWAHARRKFVEASKAMPTPKQTIQTPTQEGIDFCNRLFAIEQELHDLSAPKRYQKRLEKSRPVVEDFAAWLKYQTPRVLPKSPLGQAIQYCRNQWDKLTAFLQDGRLELDNNRSERSIKPFVIGRKNWLFANTPRGANASAKIYSLVETAKENGLIPFAYLTYLFERLPNVDIADPAVLDSLLPWATSLPESCKVPSKSIS